MSNSPAASAVGALRVLWIESGQHNPDSGLAWLHRRMQEFGAQREITLIGHGWPSEGAQASLHDHQRLTEHINSGVERIVVACVNRLDYPAELIRILQQVCPEVPLAVAYDSWWDGRGRTGLPTPSHLSLAWYRWWDGWVDWLQGSSPALFEVAPASWPVLSSSSPAAIGSHGIIVGNCRQTTDAWALAASSSGHTAECISWQQFQQQFPARWSHTLPLWVLWDDTCLDTTPAQTDPEATIELAASPENSSIQRRSQHDIQCYSDRAEQGAGAHADEAAMRVFFERLSQSTQHSHAPLHPEQPQGESRSSGGILGIVAVGMPRASWAIRLYASPRQELLVKPTGGQGLTRLVSYRSSIQGSGR